ncbi:MAG: hypothetical protein MJ193_03820, partial [Clostridia bacterium]|nr:hypothetical protein [Clostridia bacterium]
LIATINSRSTEYLFTPNRIIYRESSSATSIGYIDFSGMKGDKSSNKAKGVKSGILAENVENVFWNYDASYTKGQGEVMSDYIVYTETLTGDDSYEFCNNLKMVSYSGKVVSLADKFTYLTDEEKGHYTDYFKDKVFSFEILDLVVDNDSQLTIYYKKSNYINGAEKSTGIYMNKITADGFDTAAEIKLSNTDATSVFGLGYEKGALIEANSAYYYVKYDVASDEFATEWNGDIYSKKAVGKATTLLKVEGDYVYYYGDDTVYCINLLKETGSCPNETALAICCAKADWLSFEIVGSKFVYMDNDDYTYIHVVDLATYSDKAIETSTFIGIMTKADADSKAAKQ